MIPKAFPLAILIPLLFGCNSSPKPIPGHAHNDYESERPLFNAISFGFISIEVDVHLIQDELYVSHDRPSIMSPDRTLEVLYLEPLKNYVGNNQGRVYEAYEGPIFLMIDVKTEAEHTFNKLRHVLSNYKHLITVNGPIRVLISGNRAVDQIAQDAQGLIGIDGRLIDLNKNVPSEVMPIISDNYRNHFSWNGEGEMGLAEESKMKDLVALVHEQGKLLRFWAAPDNPAAWKLLLDSGVDIINTDDLKGFSSFMGDYEH